MVKIVSYQKALVLQSHLSMHPIHRRAHIPQRFILFSQHVVNNSVSYARPFFDQIIILQCSANHDDLPRGPNSVSLLWRIISQGLHWPFPWNHLGQGGLFHPKSFFFIKFTYQEAELWNPCPTRQICITTVLKQPNYLVGSIMTAYTYRVHSLQNGLVYSSLWKCNNILVFQHIYIDTYMFMSMPAWGCMCCSVMSDSSWPHGLWLVSSSVHGMFQARILEWVAISYSERSSLHRDQTWVSCLLHWQADSLPLCHLESPYMYYIHIYISYIIYNIYCVYNIIVYLKKEFIWLVGR